MRVETGQKPGKRVPSDGPHMAVLPAAGQSFPWHEKPALCLTLSFPSFHCNVCPTFGSTQGPYKPLTTGKAVRSSPSTQSYSNQHQDGADVLAGPKLEREGQRNKTDQNTILLMREYLLNSLYILNESYVRVNMFKALKIGLDTFW